MKPKKTEPPATGPRACLRSHSASGECWKCGAVPEVLHMPLKLGGWYCPDHCPCCNSPETTAVRSASTPLPTGGGANVGHPGAKGGHFNKPFGRRYAKYLEG